MMPTTPAQEIIISHAKRIVPATHVRSTLIQSSLRTLTLRGHYDKYLGRLDPLYREIIVNTLGPCWLPIEVGIAHYGACDALRCEKDELLAIGEAVGDRIQGTFLKTLVHAARTAGINPWVVLKRFDRLWERLLQGGSVELVKIGPKDLIIDVREGYLPQFEYFRIAFCGVVSTGIKLSGATVVQVTSRNWSKNGDRYSMHATWV
jgi:hypothetical protein